MLIDFERSGGFAGMTIKTTVDTDTLPSDEAKELGQLVSAANFFTLPRSINGGGSGADEFHYKLTVQVDELKRTVEATDSTMPDSLRPLVDRLMSMARAARQAQVK
jgi:hypothetical protein